LIAEFILELGKRGKTSFLVSNGLNPDVINDLDKKNCLPTQIYISMNAPDKKLFDTWNNSSVKDAWKKYNQSLKIIKSLKDKTRTVLRMTLVKNKNMENKHLKGYVNLIKNARPDFIEVKGFVSVGFSRKRLGYDMMPNHEEIKKFADKLVENLKSIGLKNYKVLDEHPISKVVLIGDKKKKRIINQN
jgi:tRNA wybutosine-synthesizing protein 1